MNYWRKWRRFWRKRLIEWFGGKCQSCGSTYRLEFAHKLDAPRRLNGMGRGSVRRLTDVKRNSHDYLLLCGPAWDEGTCHYKYDKGQLKL